MYLAHFGLSNPPFVPPESEHDFFPDGQFTHILKKFVYSIQTGAKVLKLTGDTGSGKTTLGLALLDALPAQFRVLFMDEPGISPSGLLYRIATDLGLHPDEHSTRLQLVKTLAAYLRDSSQTRSIVVMLDQAHALPRETLEEVRLLSEFDIGNRKHFQIVLLGSPLLDARLAQHRLKSLQARIACDASLQAPTGKEVHDYLAYRLVQADYDGPELFSFAVSKKLGRMAHGHYGRINHLADNALSVACDNTSRNIKRSYVMDFDVDSSLGKSNVWIATGATVSILTIAVLIGLPQSGLLQDDSDVVGLQAILETDLEQRASELMPAAGPADAPFVDGSEASRIGALLESGMADAIPDESLGLLADGAEPEAMLPEQERLVMAAVEPIEVPAGVSAGTELDSLKAVSQSEFERELQATGAWFAGAGDHVFSIQLHTVFDHSDQQSLRQLKRFRTESGADPVWLHFGKFSGGPAVAFLYGSYGSRGEALQAAESLPGSYNVSSPWIRPVSALRLEAISAFRE